MTRCEDGCWWTASISELCHPRTGGLRFSVVFQDYAHYNLSARENIRVADPLLDAEDSRIRRAAERAGAHEVIAGLPNGYDTVLGRWFDKGEELSIGQWQKIALARAFLRDTPLVALDEPTSSMDAAAEYDFFRRFRELSRSRSTLLISHRFSTVRMAEPYLRARGRSDHRGGGS